MRKPLGQKPEIINTHPLLEQRLAAARHGYTQNPCTLKRRTCKGWPKLACSVEAIIAHRDWRNPYFAGTALRICDDLVALDADVSSPVVAQKIRALIRALDPNPDTFDRAIMRTSGGISFAMFWRWLTPFAHLKTLSYTAHPDVLADLIEARKLPDSVERDQLLTELAGKLEPQHFEIYGSAAKGRYFQYVGPHSEGRDYQCGASAPWNTPRSALPILPVTPGELVEKIEAILALHLTVIPDEPMPDGEIFYDLDLDMEFVLKDGSHEKLGDLHEQLEWGAEHGVYGCMSDTAWAQSKSKENAKAYVTNKGRMAIKDWSHDGVMHYLKSEAPPPPVELDEYTIGILKGLMDKAAPAPDASAPDEIDHSGTGQEVHDSALGWCMRNLAWFPQAFNGRGGVVSIHPYGPYQKPITLVALRSTMARCVYEAVGPRGGSRKINPVDSWMAQTSRVEVAGVRMRPELACPLFREDGQLFVNRYVVPRHPPGGTIEPFVRNLERLVPDAVERAWVWNWFACLVQHPEWRMIALVMLAREMRSGRGLLAETLQLVLGEQFVVGIPYALVSGGAKFNAEVETRLLAYVNEAKAIDGGKYHPREAAKEALKVFVEPNHRIPFRVEPKGVDPYFTRASVSTLILTNHINGIPIDEGDGRFAIVENGGRMEPGERDAYQRWMARPENIGALWRALAAHEIEQDRSVFDPYMAPEFHARDLMIESGKTAIDRAWEAAVAKIGTAADLYTMSQVVKVARAMVMSRSPGADFDEMVERHTVNNGYRIGTRNGTNWLVTYRGERERVYALNGEGKRRYTAALRQTILLHLDAAQRVADAPTKLFNKLLRGVEVVENEE